MNERPTSKKRVLVTGGTSGLGLEIVRIFLARGYEVYAAGRNNRDISSQTRGYHFVRVDFSDLKEVAEVFYNIASLNGGFDIIVNNAGVLSPPEFTLSSNGIEYSFQVNFLSHLLTDEIFSAKKSTQDTLRIISVTSPISRYVKPSFRIPERSDYQMLRTYAETKYYLLLIGDYLKVKYESKGLIFLNFDPGTFRSGIYRMQKPWFRKMYRIGAPFLISPVRVASRFYGIIENMGTDYPVIYRSNRRFRIHNRSAVSEGNEFMERCYGMIESYLPLNRP